MSDDPSEISSDLEWMLNSGQADETMLLDALLHAHYIPLYRLALGILEEPRRAHQAAMRTIAAVLSAARRRRRPEDPQIWLYGIALKTIARIERSPQRAQAPSPVVEPKALQSRAEVRPAEAGGTTTRDAATTSSLIPVEDAELWSYVSSLGGRERRSLILYYLLAWQPSDIAALLRVNEAAVHMQLDLSRSALGDLLIDTVASSPAAAGKPIEDSSKLDDIDIDQRLSTAFQDRWPAPALRDEDWNTIHTQIEAYAQTRGARQQHLFGLKEGLFVGIVIVLFASLVGIASLLLSGEGSPAPGLTPGIQASATTNATGQESQQGYLYRAQPEDNLESLAARFGVSVEDLTAMNDLGAEMSVSPGQYLTIQGPHFAPYVAAQIETLSRTSTLSRGSQSDEILRLMETSPQLWRDMWVDAQIVDYGALSFLGPPRIYRAQAWVSQPDYSLELFGLLSERPTSLRLVMADQSFTLSPDYDLPLLAGRESKPYDLLETSLREIVFPAASPWANQDGTFRPVQREQIAGRQALIVDWINAQNKREARLWLDRETGQILRQQIYGGADFQTLLVETVVTGILFEPEIPADQLFMPANLSRQGYANLPTAESQAEVDPALTPVVDILDRGALPLDPAPDGFDPTGRWLNFQVTPETFELYEGSPATIPTELFADGYYLGQVAFGLPWGMRCDRSPDGAHLAFTIASDGALPPDHTLRWVNLRQPQEVYEPLPGYQAEYFSFAPDSKRLAVFGQAPFEPFRGIYILDMVESQSQLLLPMLDVKSLVWSPDGVYLAVFGQEYDSQQSTILLLHVRLAEVTFRRTVALSGRTQQFSWSSLAWELEFPTPMGGMDACAVAPTQ